MEEGVRNGEAISDEEDIYVMERRRLWTFGYVQADEEVQYVKYAL